MVSGDSVSFVAVFALGGLFFVSVVHWKAWRGYGSSYCCRRDPACWEVRDEDYSYCWTGTVG